MWLDGGSNGCREGGTHMGKAQDLKNDRAVAASISEQLVALETLTVGELAEKFREVFGFPTRTRNKPYLRKRVAWRIQELAEGGLSPRALAKIEELAPLAPVRWRPQLVGASPPMATASTSSRDPRLPAPGAVLVRLHKGIEHRVTVLEDGFEYRGQLFESLSQVARAISGTPWNGYLFFGLKRRCRSSQAEVGT
jgi:hypothetical protein